MQQLSSLPRSQLDVLIELLLRHIGPLVTRGGSKQGYAQGGHGGYWAAGIRGEDYWISETAKEHSGSPSEGRIYDLIPLLRSLEAPTLDGNDVISIFGHLNTPPRIVLEEGLLPAG